MYFSGYLQTDVLTFTSAITWENFFPARRDPGSAKEGSRLIGMKLFTCNRKM